MYQGDASRGVTVPIDENIVPDELFRISQEIIRYAQELTGKPIPNNFAFSLTDHIQFAIERQRKNIHVKMPFAYEVQRYVPR